MKWATLTRLAMWRLRRLADRPSGMVTKRTLSTRLVAVVLYLAVALIAFLSLLPVVNAVAISLSSSAAASAEKVYLWPVNFTLASYQQIVADADFIQAFKVSIVRV